MLVYDPQRDIAQWVPLQGMSGTLTMPELHVANDLNNMVPLPLSELLAAKPPSTEVMKCIPAGAESKTNSSIVDSGMSGTKLRQLDLKELHPDYKNRPHLGWSPCGRSGGGNGEEPNPIMGRHAKYNSTEEEENWDAVDSQSTAEDQDDDVVIEEVLIQTVAEEKESDHAVVGEPLTQQGEADEDDVE